MEQYKTSPFEIIYSCWKNRSLLKSLITRDIVGRYRGSMMGLLWSFFNPLFMLVIYTFVFGEIFNARWEGQVDSKLDFSMILFTGLVVFNVFSECINQAPNQILSNINYVKKVVFPIEVLSWVSIGTALFHFSISISVWLLAYAFIFGVPHVTILYAPLILLPFIFIVLGFSWFLSAFGVYLRDMGQVVTLLTTALMFLSPIFFPISAIPEKYHDYIMLNPLTIPIEQLRLVLFYGDAPEWRVLINYSIASVLVSWIGFYCFQKTRRGFADVL